MSFEGYYQVVCRSGHQFEVGYEWGNEKAGHWDCDCGEKPLFLNVVDETNETIGQMEFVPDRPELATEEGTVRLPALNAGSDRCGGGTWHLKGGFYAQVICERGHYHEVVETVGCVGNGDFNCPVCGAAPMWANVVDNRAEKNLGRVEIQHDANGNVTAMPGGELGHLLGRK